MDYVKISVVQTPALTHPLLRMKKPAKEWSSPSQNATLVSVPIESSHMNPFPWLSSECGPLPLDAGTEDCSQEEKGY